MKLTLHRLQLPLAHPFTISRGTITEQGSLVVELEHDGFRGFGEVTENPYYGHTLDELARAVESAEPILARYQSQTPDAVWPEALRALDGNLFALSALDMAAHDLQGKRRGIPTWRDWGLTWGPIPDSSFTIGIDSIERMLLKLQEQPGWSVYKIKLGTDRDLEIVRALRQHTAAAFRVDANCGWGPEDTVRNSQALADWGVEFIEQPLPADATRAEQQYVFEHSRLPILADENCQTEQDVRRCHGLFHGINVKLCKCGGLTPALRMLREARSLGMKTMVGCMIESSIGISAAAQLLPLLDFADLDGAVLLRADPAVGVVVQRGKIHMSDLAGNGGRLLEPPAAT